MEAEIETVTHTDTLDYTDAVLRELGRLTSQHEELKVLTYLIEMAGQHTIELKRLFEGQME